MHRADAEALLDGQEPDCARLSALPSGSIARAELAMTGGRLHRQLEWEDASAAAGQNS